MNWEAVSAIATLFTGLVIAVTALAALREVRLSADQTAATRAQLEHLRNATRFEGLLAVFEELDRPHQIDARHFVQFELAERMKDPQFRHEVSLIAGADERVHKELTVLRFFERVGFYVRKDFVDSDVVYMVASGRVVTTWSALEEVVKIHRDVAGPFWTNYEDLRNGCIAWMRSHGVNIDALTERQTRHPEPVQERRSP